jgi:hypothetical protein
MKQFDIHDFFKSQNQLNVVLPKLQSNEFKVMILLLVVYVHPI